MKRVHAIVTVAAALWCGAAAAQFGFFEAPEVPDVRLPAEALAAQQAAAKAEEGEEALAGGTLPPVQSDVFGARLFQGRFAKEGFPSFNPDYVVGIGDRISLKMWGAFELATTIEVDAQGNLFIPRVGPIRVADTTNERLNDLITRRVNDVYTDNVGVYASLVAAEPVKVFVTGNVNAPGMYGASAADSVLHFIDRAGGIDLEAGSFLDIRIQRGGETVRTINLYDFLRSGQIRPFQFRDGDAIVVGPRQSVARVEGAVRVPGQFEFRDAISLRALLEMAGLERQATHVQIIRNQTPEREAEYLDLRSADLGEVMVVSGDEVLVETDRRKGAIVVRVEGEYGGVSRFVVPYASTLADVLSRVEVTTQSNIGAVHILRKSIAERQKEVIEQTLRSLEQAVLSGRSKTKDEADLRAREADNILRFIERAREVEPRGRLLLHAGLDPQTVTMQDGDVLVIPKKTNSVVVHGEVVFPSAFSWAEGKAVDYYLRQAGGTVQPDRSSEVILVRPNGHIVASARGRLFARTEVAPGDEIMVLPKVEMKHFQFGKEIAQVISQIALTAGVILSI